MFRLGMVFALLVGCAAVPDTAANQPAASRPQSSTEFNGPFPSWTNLKTAYAAVGDGRTDDTGALQRALDELGVGGRSPVLFLPAGRYRITATLTLAHQIWLGVIGEDPGTTSIVWDGPRGGTMWQVNGVAYSRINRLTFDGRRSAAIAIDQSFDNSAPHFDTGNEYADDAFVDVEFGIHGGFKGFGFAETSIVRSRFIRNTTAGVALGNFNALDIWIWHSLFEDCGTGVTNNPGAGNFHVYGSVFRRSRIADLSMQNTGGFSARGNYSAGSRAFFVSGPTISHPAEIDIQGNTITDPIDTTAIRLGNEGPGILVDNTIRSLPGAQAAVVWWKSLSHGADVVSVGNTFTVPNPFDVNGRHISLDDRVVPRNEIRADEPALPGTPLNHRRDVLEVPRGANAAAIQALVDRAAKDGGARKVVHIPFGEYAVDRTIAVPRSDLQIVGDGPLSVLRWTGTDSGPVITVDGPTRTTLRDFRVNANKTADGILVSNVDQQGSHLYFEGLQASSGSDLDLLVDNLSQATVDFVDMGHGSTPGVSVNVTNARATIFSGASSNNSLSYHVGDGGDLLVSDMWYEGDTGTGFARVRGSGRLTMRGSRIAVPADRQTPAIDIADLQGSVTLVGDSLDDRIGVSGQSAQGRVLALGLSRRYRSSPFLTNTGGGLAILLNSRQRVERETLLNSGTVPLPDSDAASPTFLREMLERSRASVLPSRGATVPESASDLQLLRILVDNGKKNLVLTGRARR